MLELIMNADKSLNARGSFPVCGEHNGDIFVNISHKANLGKYDEPDVESFHVDIYLHDVLTGITQTIPTRFIEDKSNEKYAPVNKLDHDLYQADFDGEKSFTFTSQKYIAWLVVTRAYDKTGTNDNLTVIKSYPVGISVVNVPDADGALEGKGLELIVQWNLRINEMGEFLASAERAVASANQAISEAQSAKSGALAAATTAGEAMAGAERARADGIAAKEAAKAAAAEAARAKADVIAAIESTPLNELIECGKNLFNIDTFTQSIYCAQIQTIGEPISYINNDAYGASDWIAVEEGESYTINHSGAFIGSAVYCVDENYNIVSERISVSRGGNFTVPEGAVKIQVFAQNVLAQNNFQVEKGTVATDYEPYYKKIKAEYIQTDFTGVEEYSPLLEVIDEKIAEQGSSSLLEYGKNLFNVNAIIEGKAVEWGGQSVNGKESPLMDKAEFGTSDWIDVEEGESYVFSSKDMGSMQVLVFHFTDENHICVSNYGAGKVDVAITIPEGCKKLRFSAKLTFLKNGTAQFEKGTVKTEYQPFSVKIKEEYIPDMPSTYIPEMASASIAGVSRIWTVDNGDGTVDLHIDTTGEV